MLSVAFTLSSFLDVACLKVTFKNVFVWKDRSSCRSGACGKLTVKNILGYVAMLQRCWHGQASVVPPVPGHLCQGRGLTRSWPRLSWGSADGRCWVWALDRSIGSMLRCWAHTLGTPSSWCLSAWSCPKLCLQGERQLLLFYRFVCSRLIKGDFNLCTGLISDINSAALLSGLVRPQSHT